MYQCNHFSFTGVKYIHNGVQTTPTRLQNFSSSQTKPLLIKHHSPISPALPAHSLPLVTIPLSVSMNLPTLGTAYNGNHTVFVLSCQFIEHHDVKVHPLVAGTGISFLTAV